MIQLLQCFCFSTATENQDSVDIEMLLDDFVSFFLQVNIKNKMNVDCIWKMFRDFNEVFNKEMFKSRVD